MCRTNAENYDGMTWEGLPVVYHRRHETEFLCDGCEQVRAPIHIVSMGDMDANWCQDCIDTVRDGR